MDLLTDFSMLPQPTATTCGPTCLQAVYRYFGEDVGLGEVIAGVEALDDGGTLAALLANHALRRNYDATIYTYNLQLFDPTWFQTPNVDLAARLRAQAEAKPDAKLRVATRAYLDFLTLGGHVRYTELRADLVRRYLKQQVPILTGLSATYLHGTPREYGAKCDEDDIRGLPTGHFVVLCGYDPEHRDVLVADPLQPNPLASTHTYRVSIERVIGAILLGVLTYDANLLIIRPRNKREADRAAPDHC